MVLISVVIPSYNHEKYIKEAVESVLGQSYQNLELIVVDDGSSDASLDYLRSVDDSRFILIEQENSGAHSAINKGLAHAKGEVLSILNSDDIFHPDRLRKCLERLQGDADLVATWIEVIDDKGRRRGVKKGWKNMLPWSVAVNKNTSNRVDDFAYNLLITNFVSTTSNIVFTRNLYNFVGGMRNLRFVHDWDFLLRAAKNYRCVLIEEPLLKYRTHQTNTISSNRGWMLFEICWIYAVHLRSFLKNISSGNECSARLSVEINFLVKSINLQNNDRLMWMLLYYLDEFKHQGIANPEELLLEDKALRSSFIDVINV